MRPNPTALAILLLLPLTLALPAADPPAPPPAPALDLARPPVMVVVDSNRVLANSNLAKMLEGRLKGLEESIRHQLDPMQQGLEKRRADFEADSAKMTPDQKEKESRALADLEDQLQSARQQAQQAYNQQRDALAFQMRQALEPVLDALGKEKGWDMILSRPGSDLVWYSKRLDVSDLVIERLNALPLPEPKGGAAKGQAPAAGAKTPPPAPAPKPEAQPKH